MTSHVDWLKLLGWSEEQIEDIRFAGYSFLKQGHYEHALKFFEVLTILSQSHLYDLQTVGALYLQTGNNLAALNYLERALKLDSSHEPTLLNHAKALLLLGYKKRGLSQVRTLTNHSDKYIADQAQALVLAYS